MQIFQFIVHFIFTLFLLLNVSKAQEKIYSYIVVDQSGKGNFTKVQDAIDSIPSNNNFWTQIHVKAGVYNEKVIIPQEKPNIVLKGESRRVTIIRWGDSGSSLESATFKLYADNFVARDITFKNSFDYALENGVVTNMTWAPAAFIQGDKASFYRCAFEGLQDTLTDWKGRHYFVDTFIEGAIDFIWGSGQSIYQGCILNVTASRIGTTAYITAQSRGEESDNSGFVFKYCNVIGTGPAFLGRAYGSHARVVYYGSTFSNIIAPEGWDAWYSKGKENNVAFSEVDCKGPGANVSNRVEWEKNLSQQELQALTSTDVFINKDQWIEKQPQSK